MLLGGLFSGVPLDSLGVRVLLYLSLYHYSLVQDLTTVGAQ